MACAWLVVVGIFVAIGIKVSAKAQYVLMAMQMIPLLLFAFWALIRGVRHAPGRLLTGPPLVVLQHRPHR